MTSARRVRLPASFWLVPILLVAAALRAAPWFKPHVFTGVMEYDDGVYYAASRALLHGLVPYRDFTIVHPPLATLLFAPAAAIGAVAGDPAGLAVARVEVLLAECVNVWLVYRLTLALTQRVDVRRAWPAFVAAGIYAVAPGAVTAGHTALLEPMTTLFALLAMGWLLRQPLTTRAAVAGGASLAAALGVKLFAGVYVVVAAGWLLATARDRMLPAALGFAGALAIIFVPVIGWAGPRVMWRDLVASQLMRPADGGLGTLSRLRSLFGVGVAPAVTGAALLALCTAAIVAAVVEIRRRRAPLSPQLWVWAAIAVLSAVSFLRSPSYFDHYAGFFAAPFAITVGAALVTATVSRRLVLAMVSASVAGLVVVNAFGAVRGDSRWQASPSFQPVADDVPRGACVYTDAVSLLVAADRLRLPDRRCPGWLDGRGQNLVWSIGRRHRDDFYPRGFRLDRRWQVQTLDQVEAASYLLVRSDPRQMPEWTDVIRAYAADHFRQVWAGSGRIPAQLWVRVS
jgi:alpha-1,2-mannosyltransferase